MVYIVAVNIHMVICIYHMLNGIIKSGTMEKFNIYLLYITCSHNKSWQTHMHVSWKQCHIYNSESQTHILICFMYTVALTLEMRPWIKNIMSMTRLLAKCTL